MEILSSGGGGGGNSEGVKYEGELAFSLAFSLEC